jgi:hypothetical protein
MRRSLFSSSPEFVVVDPWLGGSKTTRLRVMELESCSLKRRYISSKSSRVLGSCLCLNKFKSANDMALADFRVHLIPLWLRFLRNRYTIKEWLFLRPFRFGNIEVSRHIAFPWRFQRRLHMSYVASAFLRVVNHAKIHCAR